MIKLLHFALIAILLGGAGKLYTLKYQATADVTHIQRLKNDIAKEKDTIQRLEAEWAYLNRPDYLQSMVEKHLAMKPLALNQIGIRDIRERPHPLPDPLTRMLEAMERANKEVVTAKITPKKPAPKAMIKPRYSKPRDITDIIAGLEPKKAKKKP